MGEGCPKCILTKHFYLTWHFCGEMFEIILTIYIFLMIKKLIKEHYQCNSTKGEFQLNFGGIWWNR